MPIYGAGIQGGCCLRNTFLIQVLTIFLVNSALILSAFTSEATLKRRYGRTQPPHIDNIGLGRCGGALCRQFLFGFQLGRLDDACSKRVM